MPVAMNNTDNAQGECGDVAKCQQAVHGLNIASLAVSGKLNKWGKQGRGVYTCAQVGKPESAQKKAP